jgi:hypothetical protein
VREDGRTIQQFPLNLPNQAKHLFFLNLVHPRYIKSPKCQLAPIQHTIERAITERIIEKPPTMLERKF